MIEMDITNIQGITTTYGKRAIRVDSDFLRALELIAQLTVDTYQEYMHKDSGEMARTTKYVRKGPLDFQVITLKDYWKYEVARDGDKEGQGPHDFRKVANPIIRQKSPQIIKMEVFDGFKKEGKKL